jgi:hypothetical protein
MVLIANPSRFFTFFKTSVYTLKNTADERSASLIFVDHQSINLRVRAQVETYIEKMNNNGFDGEKIVNLVKTTLAELKQ